MRSPRLTERVSRISSEPRAIVSTTAAVVSVIPARLIGESRSRSHLEATRATTTGAAAPMIPALAGLVWRRPAYQMVELPTNLVSASTIAAAQSRRASGGSGPSSAREVVSLAHDARQEMERPCRDGADRAERHEWRATSSFSSSPPSFSPSCHPPPDPRASRGRSCSDSRGGPKTCQGENTGWRGGDTEEPPYLGGQPHRARRR